MELFGSSGHRAVADTGSMDVAFLFGFAMARIINSMPDGGQVM